MKIKVTLLAALLSWSLPSFAMEITKNESKKSDYQPSRLTLKLAVIDNFARTLASYALSEKPFPCTYPQSKTLLTFLLTTTLLSTTDSRETKLKNITQVFEKLIIKYPETIVHDIALMFFFRVLFDKRDSSNEFGAIKYFYLNELFFDLKIQVIPVIKPDANFISLDTDFAPLLKLPEKHQELIKLIQSNKLYNQGIIDSQITINTIFEDRFKITFGQDVMDTLFPGKGITGPFIAKKNQTFLTKAINSNNKEALVFLLFLNADITIKARGLDDPFSSALLSHDPDTFELLCSAVSPEKYFSPNPVAELIGGGNDCYIELLTVLLKYPFPLYNLQEPEQSPLHKALAYPPSNNLIEPLEKIVKALKERDQYGSLPNHLKLHIACALGEHVVLKDISPLEIKTSIQELSQETLLHTAAKFGHAHLVCKLIDQGAFIDKRDKYAYTALYTAIMYGQQEIVKILLEKGADPCNKVNENTQFETSPLRLAKICLGRADKAKYQAIVDLLEAYVCESKLEKVQAEH